jgi:hypothetical protein
MQALNSLYCNSGLGFFIRTKLSPNAATPQQAFPERGYPTTEKARMMRAFLFAREYAAILRAEP